MNKRMLVGWVLCLVAGICLSTSAGQAADVDEGILVRPGNSARSFGVLGNELLAQQDSTGRERKERKNFSSKSSREEVESSSPQVEGSSDNSTGKERKERKNFVSKSQKEKQEQDAASSYAEVEFIKSEDGYWNARCVNAPLFTDGGSVNSVMNENKRSHRAKPLRTSPVRTDDVEIVGGKSTEITGLGGKAGSEDKSEGSDR